MVEIFPGAFWKGLVIPFQEKNSQNPNESARRLRESDVRIIAFNDKKLFFVANLLYMMLCEVYMESYSAREHHGWCGRRPRVPTNNIINL